jgi:hypothetical protein
MTKYTPATIAKAIMGGVVAAVGAATVSAHGTDLSVLDLGEWLGALGTGFVAAAGVFVTPNKDHEPAPAPADQVINGLQAVQDQAATAQAELARATAAVKKVASSDLVQQVIDSVK